MLRLWVIACLALAAPQASAGAWPRAEGTTFLSFSAEFGPESGAAPYSAVYAEYGLTERLTLGLDAGVSGDSLDKGVLFARVPLGRAQGGTKLAVELGLGVTGEMAVLRPGLMAGRGLTMGDMSGWIALDTLAVIGKSDTALSTDLTLGVNLSTRLKLILQLQSGHRMTEMDYLKFAPSVVYERKPGQHLELGVLAGLESAGDFALKLGMWRHF